MTVEARAQRVLYQGNGTAVEFPFDFAVYAANQVRVVTADAFGNETERAHGAEFSVRLGAGGVGGYAGGTVVYPLSGAPLAPGEKIAVLSAVPSTQDKSFPNNTPYFQEQIEGGLDKATRLIQQLEADVARSIKVPPTSAESPEDMGAELLGARDEAVAAAESAGGALVGAEAARDAAVSKTVAQNAAVNAGEDAERADKAAADAEKAALVAQAAERGQGIYTVRRADCLPHCPEGFYIVDPRLIVAGTDSLPLVPVERAEDIPAADGFYLLAAVPPRVEPEEPDNPDRDPETCCGRRRSRLR